VLLAIGYDAKLKARHINRAHKKIKVPQSSGYLVIRQLIKRFKKAKKVVK
jgi:hypothetical protein